MNATATSATTKDPLPISPLTRVVSGGGPLKDVMLDEGPVGKGLHVGLLVVLWFLPGTVFLGMISLYAGPGWGLLFAWAAWLAGYAFLACTLTALVSLAPSIPWTLGIHAAACVVVHILETATSNEVL